MNETTQKDNRERKGSKEKSRSPPLREQFSVVSGGWRSLPPDLWIPCNRHT